MDANPAIRDELLAQAEAAAQEIDDLRRDGAACCCGAVACEVTGQRRRSVLVVSHGMYNDQRGIPTVLTMLVLAGTGDDLGTWCVPIGAGEVAVVDHMGRTAKAVLERRVRVVDSQVVMDVNNALFTILSTS